MVYLSNKTKRSLPTKHLIALTEDFLRQYRRLNQEVSLAFIGAARMRTLNFQYRGFDKTTDVLSFNGEAACGSLGEVLVNLSALDKLKDYQEILEFLGFNYPPRTKKMSSVLLDFIVVHGLLHLVGYDDATEPERQKMLRLGRNFLTKHGIINP